MRDAFALMWAFLARLFTALDRVALTLDHGARWAEVETRYLADSAEVARADELLSLASELDQKRAKAQSS